MGAVHVPNVMANEGYAKKDIRALDLLNREILLQQQTGGIMVTSTKTGVLEAQSVPRCREARQGLCSSYADCLTSNDNILNVASDASKGLSFRVVIGLWMAADVLLGMSQTIYPVVITRGTR